MKALSDYKKAVRKAKRERQPKPPVPKYIAECFWNIAENFSHKPKFLRYSYRDEMVADGAENCLMYFENFDPKISKNPFAYFSQFIYYAFLRRIAKEHKQQYVKYKMISQSGIYDQLTSESMGNYENITAFIENFENNLKEKKIKKIMKMKEKKNVKPKK